MRIKATVAAPRGYYNQLTEKWLDAGGNLQDLYPNGEERLPDIIRHYAGFSPEQRAELVQVLEAQYDGMAHPGVLESIRLLASPDSYTVTTGQQIHIYLGPAFVIYKIWSVIRQARALSRILPGKNIIPVFWMATEDHDLDEIDHIHLFGKAFRWEPGLRGGPVGRIDTGKLSELTAEINALAGPGQDFSALLEPFFQAYRSGNSLAKATRQIINDFFGHEGLVVIDPDEPEFKRRFLPVMKADILESGFASTMAQGSESLQHAGFRVQVNPRQHHFFMLQDGKRLRIDSADAGFVLEPGGFQISAGQMEERLNQTPESFSPNVLLRPLYQQSILPNLAYVCGPAELAYWHQLNPAFLQAGIPAPLLRLRDSFVWIDRQAAKHMDELNLPMEVWWSDARQAAGYLQEKLAGESGLKKILIDIGALNQELKNELYKLKSPALKELVKQSEQFAAAIKKEDARASVELRNGPLAHLFSKLAKLQERIFNPESPQERSTDWIELYLKHGLQIIPRSYAEMTESHIFGLMLQED